MDTSISPLVIQIDGGIGRIICATPAIEKLAKRTERKIILLTSCPDVFRENPYVHKAYNLSSDYLWEDVIRHGEFLFPEPYYSHLYYNQKHHLIQAFNYILNDKCEDFSFPHLYLNRDEQKWGEEFIQARKDDSAGKPVGILQCFGAGASLNCGDFKDDTQRSLPPDRVDFLLKQLEKDCIFINASHLPLRYDHVWQQTFTTRQLFSLIKACDFLVGVDSFASHAGAAFGRKGILFLGATYGQNVGYPNYKMVYRDGYPKAYFPNRFGGSIEKQNEGALDFSDAELTEIADVVRRQDFPTWEEYLPVSSMQESRSK